MKVCIFGAGAIGGFLGFELAEAGLEVSLIARGPHMQAIKADGLVPRRGGEERRRMLVCTDDPSELGPQDYVIVCLKAHSVPAVAAAMPQLFDADTAVVMAVNGLPWWIFVVSMRPRRWSGR